MKISINAVFEQCTLLYLQYILQLPLELLLILFTTNTLIVIKNWC